MGCTTCGSGAACGCSNGSNTCNVTAGAVCTYCYQSGCCGSCNQSGSCTRNLVPTSPQPFYASAPACQESNTKKIIINQFSQALKAVNTWNVPACGLTATLTIPGLTSIVIGSYLWNAEFGYFEVTAFDSGLQQVTVINNCNEGNATAGTNVPACTEFLNASPPAEDAPSNTPCVEIDFTAPAVGDCLDITLNNTTGILAGDTVQIGSGFYRVSEVKPNDIINICNDGDGITPGTSVIAKDAAGNYQYCLQIISTSPCDREVITNGSVVSCNSSEQVTTLEMPEDAWIFEGTLSSGTNAVGAIPLGLPPFCSRLIAALNVITGTANYTLNVSDASGFEIGSLVQIAGYPNVQGLPNVRMEVTGAPSPTQITVTFDTVPLANKTMPIGTVVCRIGCCELLSNEIDELTCTPPVFRLDVNSFAYSVPIVLDSDGYVEAVVDASIIPVDLSGAACPDGTYAVVAHLSIASNADFVVAPTDFSELGTIYHELEIRWSTGATPSNRTAGKIVYTDSIGDTRATSVPQFPNVPEATFDILPAPAPNYPLNYNQADVSALAIITPSTGSIDLGLSYRGLVGDFEAITVAYDNMDILISGWIDVYLVNA